MMSEFPLATAMALMKEPFAPFLMFAQAGVAAFTFTLRQRLLPPASSVLKLLGSRMNGAMKLAADSGSPDGPDPSGSPSVADVLLSGGSTPNPATPASPRPPKMSLEESPALLLR